jgi:hypothetical protein
MTEWKRCVNWLHLKKTGKMDELFVVEKRQERKLTWKCGPYFTDEIHGCDVRATDETSEPHLLQS